MGGGQENAPCGVEANTRLDRALANAAGDERIALIGASERGSP